MDETRVKLEQRIINEASQRQEQLAKLSEQIGGTAQQFDLFLKATNQYQEDLAKRLEQTRQRAEQLEHVINEQGVRLTRLETLEQTVAEQGKQLARYEPLLQLSGRFESLYSELINRGLLQTETPLDQ
jgi:ABC-type transporter Mla subunit MlaD